jgi:predicted AAA+ superfamily ATPase
MKIINRILSSHIKNMSTKYPIVTITGPRQSGKTTLCKTLFPKKIYINLEHPQKREYAISDPVSFLEELPNGAILDEIQRVPQLLSYIQTIVDEDEEELKGRFILTGSHQFQLMDEVNQSLAGRTSVIKLLPFSISEIKNRYENNISLNEILFKGFYPRVFKDEIPPYNFFSDYIATYVERDIRQLINIKNIDLFRRFIGLVAGRVGQLINFQSLADDTGISQSTAKEWLSILNASYITFALPPYLKNINKRLIKTPKIYFYDVGLACNLLGIETSSHLTNHPLRGGLFENLIVAESIKHRFNEGKSSNLFFYRDSAGNEIDLILEYSNKLLPIEIKSAKSINSSFFDNINLFYKTFSNSHNLKSGSLLIYSGSEKQKRDNCLIRNHLNFTESLSRIT